MERSAAARPAVSPEPYAFIAEARSSDVGVIPSRPNRKSPRAFPLRRESLPPIFLDFFYPPNVWEASKVKRSSTGANLDMLLNVRFLRRALVGVAGTTVIAAGAAMLVLPGPGLITIALGLGILGTEFAWPKSFLKRVREAIAKGNPLKPDDAR